jgi:hypothetical protein
MQGSGGGSFWFYGTATVHKLAIDYYFNDKPHRDWNTWVAPGQWDANYNGNGVLDPVDPVEVEDTDDDGEIDNNENDGDTSPPHDDADGSRDGDYPVKSGESWDFNRDLSPFDIDDDGKVELPQDNEVPVTTDEHTRAQVTRHTITHEMGHAVNIGGHCDHPDCVMYMYVENWKNDYHFCTDCRSEISIHNN